jgi:preprotein translocase subunit SecA
VEGVAAVDLGAGGAAGRAAVVAADEELSGREAGRVEAVEDVADLAGRGVDVVLGAVAVEADRVGAAAESGELAEDTRQRALRGQVREFRKWCGSGAGEDGVSPSDLLGREEQAPGRRNAWSCAAAPEASAVQRRWWSRSMERRTTAATATEMAVTATAVRSAVRTTPPTTKATTVF